MKQLGLYIHIPFCRKKCLYCDFPSFDGLNDLQEKYVSALTKEIACQGASFSKYNIDTIYIGGGTPTSLNVSYIGLIMDSLRGNFNISEDCEITIECNPATVDYEYLKRLRTLAINRLSLGVQSFDDNILQAIGRLHSKNHAIQAVEDAKKAGFNNISIDLMYGLPKQTKKIFRESLETAISLDLQHISVYGLKIEENTPFYQMKENGRLILPSEDDEEAMYDLKVQYLSSHDFNRYEISNYAKKGFISKHNIKYWNFDEYLGLGSGAHSFINLARYNNTSDVKEYIKDLNEEQLPIDNKEELTKEDAMGEAIFLALRMVMGLNIINFNKKFNVNFSKTYASEIQYCISDGLLEESKGYIKLTPKGMKYGNQVFVRFV